LTDPEGKHPLDPAHVDRRDTLIAGISESALPWRRMTIAGMEGGLDARILSTDMSGPATRVVTFQIGWGSGIPGAFTATVEIFVLDGEISIGEHVLTANDYAFISGGGVVPGVRARTTGRAPFMTAAPVRYDTASGGRSAQLEIAHAADIEWSPLPPHDGRFVKVLRSDGDGEAWLSGALEWSHGEGTWHRHSSGEECYVIDGEVSFSERTESGPMSHTYGPGGYVWRPPGTLHGGPGSGAADTALTFHRTPGSALETEWVQTVPADEATS
jgi:glyoxylate utilization-related uncharacterized protein